MIAVLLGQAMVQTLAKGLPQAVPATRFACEMRAGDGTNFKVSGTAPAFERGWDPNRSKMMRVEGDHPAFRGTLGIDPGEASDWFREYQLSSLDKGVRYQMQLSLRRAGTSIAHSTRYESSGRAEPFDYHAVGLCTANFAPAPATETERP